MSIVFPKYLWLATGGSNNIADKYFTSVKDRKIILFPDLSIDNSIFDKWHQKTIELQKFGFDITTSMLLEEIANETDKQNGFDIADYFLILLLKGIRGQGKFYNSPPLKEECPKGEVVAINHPFPSPKACLPNGGMSGQMGIILTKQQQTLAKLITKNPAIEKLITTFDLVINS